MEVKKKLKPKQLAMTIFTLVLLSILGVGWIFFGQQGFNWTFGSIQVLMALIHFTVMLRTRNLIYLNEVLLYVLWALTFLPPLAGHPWHNVFAVASAVFLFIHIGILISKRINWRYREILELAARPVEDISNGFTSRPFPSGQADFTRKDAVVLARFLLKHVAVFPFFETDRVVFVIPRYMWAYLLFPKRNYDNGTYVALYDSGQITVRIARIDYESFKEELTFDQLCASLGNLFKQFLRLSIDGKPGEIIKQLNAV